MPLTTKVRNAVETAKTAIGGRATTVRRGVRRRAGDAKRRVVDRASRTRRRAEEIPREAVEQAKRELKRQRDRQGEGLTPNDGGTRSTPGTPDTTAPGGEGLTPRPGSGATEATLDAGDGRPAPEPPTDATGQRASQAVQSGAAIDADEGPNEPLDPDVVKEARQSDDQQQTQEQRRQAQRIGELDLDTVEADQNPPPKRSAAVGASDSTELDQVVRDGSPGPQQRDLGDDFVPDSVEDPISGVAEFWDDQAATGADLLVPDRPAETLTSVGPGPTVRGPQIGGKNVVSATVESGLEGIARGANPGAVGVAAIETAETGVFFVRGISEGDLSERGETIGEQATLVGRSTLQAANQDPLQFGGTLVGGGALEGAALSAAGRGARAGAAAGRSAAGTEFRTRLDEFRSDTRGQADLAGPESVSDTKTRSEVDLSDPPEIAGTDPNDVVRIDADRVPDPNPSDLRTLGEETPTTDLRVVSSTGPTIQPETAALLGGVETANAQGRTDIVQGALGRRRQAEASSLVGDATVDAAEVATDGLLETADSQPAFATQAVEQEITEAVGTVAADLTGRLDEAATPQVSPRTDTRPRLDERADILPRSDIRSATRVDTRTRIDTRLRARQRIGTRTDTRLRSDLRTRTRTDQEGRRRRFPDFDFGLPDGDDDERRRRGGGLIAPYANPVVTAPDLVGSITDDLTLDIGSGNESDGGGYDPLGDLDEGGMG